MADMDDDDFYDEEYDTDMDYDLSEWENDGDFKDPNRENQDIDSNF